MKSSDMQETVAESPSPGESPSSPSVLEPPRSSKILFSAVIIMGVLIIIGVVVLLWVIVQRIQHPEEAQSLVSSSAVTRTVPPSSINDHDVLAPPATLNLILRKGEHLHSLIARPDGSMAVDLKTEQGTERVVIWLPEQARIRAELELKPETYEHLK